MKNSLIILPDFFLYSLIGERELFGFPNYKLLISCKREYKKIIKTPT